MLIRLDFAPTPDTIKDYAENAVLSMRDVYSIQMDYSVDSLAQVDRVLHEWREGGAPLEAVTKSLYALGAYAGEAVLRADPRGRWVVPPKAQYGAADSLFMYVTFPDGRVWPCIALTFEALMGVPRHTLEGSAKGVLAGQSVPLTDPDDRG